MLSAEERLRQLDAEIAAQIEKDNAAVLAVDADKVSKAENDAKFADDLMSIAERLGALDRKSDLNVLKADLESIRGDLEYLRTNVPDNTHDLEYHIVYDGLINVQKEIRDRELSESTASEPPQEVTPPVDAGPVDAPEVFSENDLDDARAKYRDARKRLSDAKGMMGIGNLLNRSTVKKVEAELTTAQAELKSARVEYAASSTENFLQLQTKITEDRLASYDREKKGISGGFKWAADSYKKLGATAVFGSGEYTGKFVRGKKFLNNYRTLVNAGLFGVAIAAGPAGWIGLGSMGLRRAIGGFGSGLATFELVKSARRANLEKKVSDQTSPAEIEEIILSIESRALLDGQQEQLQSNKYYQELRSKHEERLKNIIETMTPDGRADFYSDYLDGQDSLFTDRLAHEKKWNKLALLTGVATGTLVGTGTAAKLGGKVFHGVKELVWGHSVIPSGAAGAVNEHIPSQSRSVPGTAVGRGIGSGEAPPQAPGSYEEPSGAENVKPGAGSAEAIGKPSSPVGGQEIPGSAADSAHAEALRHAEAEPTQTIDRHLDMKHGAKLDIKGDTAVISAGNRGLEGSLLDLKDADPARYQDMLENLKKAYPDFKGNDAGIIHRYVADYAQEHGYTIGDGGPKDLNWISHGEIQIDKENLLHIGHENFIPDTSKQIGSAAEAASQHSQAVSEAPATDADITKEEFLLSRKIGNSGLEDSTNILEVPQTHELDRLADLDPTKAAREMAAESLIAQKNGFDNGLRLYLYDKYDRFVGKTLNLNSKSLDKIKDMNFSKFLEKVKNPGSDFGKKYALLAREIGKMKIGMPGGREKMRFVILELAKRFEK